MPTDSRVGQSPTEFINSVSAIAEAVGRKLRVEDFIRLEKEVIVFPTEVEVANGIRL